MLDDPRLAFVESVDNFDAELDSDRVLVVVIDKGLFIVDGVFYFEVALVNRVNCWGGRGEL